MSELPFGCVSAGETVVQFAFRSTKQCWAHGTSPAAERVPGEGCIGIAFHPLLG